MNTLQAKTVRAPTGDKEIECAVFAVTDPTTPFVFHNIAEVLNAYMFSFWIRGDSAGQIVIEGQSVTVTTEWSKWELLIYASSTDIAMYFKTKGTFYICESKLESGNKATAWSPAPEDMEERADGLDKRITSAETSIVQTSNKIESLVKSTSSIDSRLSAAESRITQNADGISAVVKTTESIKTSTDEKFSATDSEIGALNVFKGATVKNFETVNSNISDVSNALDDFKASEAVKWKSAESKITQNADGISAVVKTTESIKTSTDEKFSATDGKIDTLSGNLSDFKSSTKAEFENTNSNVSETSDALANFKTSEAAKWKSAESKITQNADGISSLVKTTTSLGGRLDTAEASIKMNSGAIELKVNKNGIVSAINQSSESVKIQASKISLEGLTTINNLFKVNTDGSIEATNATISGKITASTGTIGGWRITADALDSTNSKGNYIFLANGSNTNQDVLVVRTGAGTTADPYCWPVIVRATGQAIFDNANITGEIHATTATIDEIVKMKDIGGSTVTVLSAGVSIDDPHSLWINPWGEIDTVRIRGNSVEIGGNFNVAGGSAQFDSDVSVAGEIHAPCIELSNHKAYIDFHCDYSTADFTSRIIEASSGVLRINSLDVSSDDRLTFTNHKGGFYMIDDVWVRTYGNKNFYCDQTIRSHKGLQVEGLDDGGAGLRLAYGNYGFMIRNDGVNTYFLLTNSGDPYGQWRNVYPFIIDNSNGTTQVTDLYFNDWSGTNRKPIASMTGDGRRIAYLSSNKGGAVGINGQYGNSDFATRMVNTTSSDVRLKTNVVPTEEQGLPMLRRIKMRSFDWTDTGKHQKIGFVADELEELDPSFSIGGGYDEDGCMIIKSVDSFYLSGYVVKGIQELDLCTQQLKQENFELKTHIGSIEYALNQAFVKIGELEKKLTA